MAAAPFQDEDARVLTPEAFDFVLRNELKRAVRSQNFLTLLLVSLTGRGVDTARTPGAHELARVVSREVRETDLLSHDSTGQLSVVLLDTDLMNSMRVLDRLLARFEHHELSAVATISVGAACCPTHGADLESLRRAAETRAVSPPSESRGNSSNVQ